MIKVSIVVPTYNWFKYLSKCIDSILSQSVNNFEVIIVDGWSTDWTLNIIEDYMNKDRRIKLIHQYWKWLWNARNIGINNSKWEYITFIDCDDFIKQDFIESFIKKMDEWFDMIIWWFIKYKSESNKKKIYIKDNWIWKYLDTWPRWRFIKKSFLLGNNIKFLNNSLREDAHFNITIFNSTKKITIIHHAWYYYRISNDDSMCKTICRKFDPNYIDWLDKMWEIKPIDKFHEICKEYFLIRAVIFYLLYSWRWVSSNEFMAEYKKLFWWLKKNIPNFKKNKYIYGFTESSILYQLSIWIFLLIDKFHLVKLFSKIYCVWNK